MAARPANRHAAPPRGGPAPPSAVLTFPTSALPMEMTLMRRDLPGSFRFGTLASIALALSGPHASASARSPRRPVPQASSSNGGTAAGVTARAPRLAIPGAARPRTWRLGAQGGRGARRQGAGGVSRC